MGSELSLCVTKPLIVAAVPIDTKQEKRNEKPIFVIILAPPILKMIQVHDDEVCIIVKQIVHPKLNMSVREIEPMPGDCSLLFLEEGIDLVILI